MEKKKLIIIRQYNNFCNSLQSAGNYVWNIILEMSKWNKYAREVAEINYVKNLADNWTCFCIRLWLTWLEHNRYSEWIRANNLATYVHRKAEKRPSYLLVKKLQNEFKLSCYTIQVISNRRVETVVRSTKWSMKNTSKMKSLMFIAILAYFYPKEITAHVSLTFPQARKYQLDFLDTFR